MAQVSTTTPGSKINDATGKVVRTRSRFPQMSYPFYNTQRFAVYHPFFVMEGVEGDRLPIRSSHEVRSFTLKAPLMQDIKRKKDFFKVDMRSILPNNFDKFYTNPLQGDDVDWKVGTGYKNFWSSCPKKICDNALSYLRTTLGGSGTDMTKLTLIFRFLIVCEMFYSNGNLISALGCHVGHRSKIYPKESTQQLDVIKNGDFDRFFDAVIADIVAWTPYFTAVIDGDTRMVICRPDDVDVSNVATATISLHDFLEYLRDDLTVSVDSIGTSVPLASTAIGNWFDSTKVDISFTSVEEDYNLARLWAYQLSIAHFYTNDAVDFIYSADLFRGLISYYVRRFFASNMAPFTFTYNGVPYEYDAMSSAYLWKIANTSNIGATLLDCTSSDGTKALAGYFCALFSYRRSLRFVDYFTGSRTRPLAVGNVDVNVQSNKVNIVDVSRNIQVQRFLNAVNRSGRKFREYIKMMAGVDPGPDSHDPLYLGHTADTIFGVETENTGVSQMSEANSITSRFQSNGARYQFEVDVDAPCVIIGLSYYDIERVYVTTTDRQLHHTDRFDMFNPFMQFIGDQELDITELGSKRKFTGATYPFGYQLRHMEYKQRFPVASGGFINNLPGFIFDNKADDLRSAIIPVQSPDFIRSLPSELDRFYVSLTGFSLGTYFHFIVKDYNFVDASRPMAYAPSIL